MNPINILRICFILLFFLIMYVPLFFTVFNSSVFRSVDIGENRTLISKEVLKDTKLLDYPKQIEKYLNDNMAFRTQIIKMYHYIFAWQLYSPVSNIIRINNQIFNIDLVKRYLNTPSLNIHFNELLTGMHYISKYNGIQFMYVMVPDKISYEEAYLPNWMHKFKERHNIATFYKQVSDNIKEHQFINIDILDLFNKNGDKLYSDRYDINHYNHRGLELSLNSIATELSYLFNNKFSLVEYMHSYNFEEIIVQTFPYIGMYGREIVPWMSFALSGNNIKAEKVSWGKIDKANIWASTDYIVNPKKIDGVNLIFVSDSSFKAMRQKNGITGRNGSVTPLVCVCSKYVHEHINFFDYQRFLSLKEYINADVLIYSITERQVPLMSRDKIFQIVGRYALGKNENFIFPEDIIFSSEEISSADIEINKNNKYIDIGKQLITDGNGEIYISFRYKSPAKTKALLEYSTNRDFTNSKKTPAQVTDGGGGDGWC